MIGKFEELVLMSLMRAGPKSPASDVYEVIAGKLKTEPKFGAVYTTLDRMVSKKYVKVKEEKSAKTGRTRRYFTITGLGQTALSEAMQASQELSRGLVIPGLGVGA